MEHQKPPSKAGAEPESQAPAQVLIWFFAAGFIGLGLEYAYRDNNIPSSISPFAIGIVLFFLGLFWPKLAMILAPNFAKTAAAASTDFRTWVVAVLLVFLGISMRPLVEYFLPKIQAPLSYILKTTTYPENSLNAQGLLVEANGAALVNYGKKYLLVAVAYHQFAGGGDGKDFPITMKSKPVDIANGTVPIVMLFTPKFVEEMKTMSSTTYGLLLVPKGVEPSQFSTVHEAEKIGVIALQATFGPP